MGSHDRDSSSGEERELQRDKTPPTKFIMVAAFSAKAVIGSCKMLNVPTGELRWFAQIE
jgi:hypothetical protein